MQWIPYVGSLKEFIALRVCNSLYASTLILSLLSPWQYDMGIHTLQRATDAYHRGFNDYISYEIWSGELTAVTGKL